MELTITPSQSIQPAFMAKRGKKKILQKIEKRLSKIREQQQKREAWEERGRAIKRLATINAGIAGAATIITTKDHQSRNSVVDENQQQSKEVLQQPEKAMPVTNDKFNVGAEQTINTERYVKSVSPDLEHPKPTVYDYNMYFVKYYSDNIKNFPHHTLLYNNTRAYKIVDSFWFQKEIADKIISHPSLYENSKFLVDYLPKLHAGYIQQVPEFETFEGEMYMVDRCLRYFKEQTDARIKLLDAYANNEKLQQGEHSVNIGEIVFNIQNNKEADLLINVIENNIDKADFEEKVTWIIDAILRRANIDLVKKIESNEILYNSFKDLTNFHVVNEKEVAKRIINILDYYLEVYNKNESLMSEYSNFTSEIFPRILVEYYINNSNSYMKKTESEDFDYFKTIINYIVLQQFTELDKITGAGLPPMSNEYLKYAKGFNILKAFDYMREHYFSKIDEYTKAGNALIHNIEDSKEDRHTAKPPMLIPYNPHAYNTLKYQEELAKKILSSDVLVDNKNIRKYLFFLVTDDYNRKIPANQAGINRLEAKLKEQTNARIKLLDTYANDKDMQNNAEIRNEIGYLAQGVQTMEECDFIIDVLKDKEGKYKVTKENFRKPQFGYNLYDILSCYIRERNIPISLISRILEDPVIEDSVRYGTIHEILKQDKSNLDKLNIVLDLMQKKLDVVKSIRFFDHDYLRYAFFKTNDPVGDIAEALGC